MQDLLKYLNFSNIEQFFENMEIQDFKYNQNQEDYQNSSSMNSQNYHKLDSLNLQEKLNSRKNQDQEKNNILKKHKNYNSNNCHDQKNTKNNFQLPVILLNDKLPEKNTNENGRTKSVSFGQKQYQYQNNQNDYINNINYNDSNYSISPNNNYTDLQPITRDKVISIQGDSEYMSTPKTDQLNNNSLEFSNQFVQKQIKSPQNQFKNQKSGFSNKKDDNIIINQNKINNNYNNSNNNVSFTENNSLLPFRRQSSRQNSYGIGQSKQLFNLQQKKSIFVADPIQERQIEESKLNSEERMHTQCKIYSNASQSKSKQSNSKEIIQKLKKPQTLSKFIQNFLQKNQNKQQFPIIITSNNIQINNISPQSSQVINNGIKYSIKIIITKQSDDQLTISLQIEDLEFFKQQITKDLCKAVSNRMFKSQSHEFGTYLNIIINLAECLKATDDITQVAELSQIIIDNSTILKNILQDYRDYQQIMTQKLQVQYKQVQFFQEFEKCINLFDNHFQLKNMQIQKPEIKVNIIQNNIYLDIKRFQQILCNIITNAIKCTKKGGVIKFDYEIEDQYLRIIVKDTGVGMSPNEIQNLQKLLKNGHISHPISEKSAGYGFGILIADRLARYLAHDKDIGIGFTSIENKGTSVWFSIKIDIRNGLFENNIQKDISSDQSIVQFGELEFDENQMPIFPKGQQSSNQFTIKTGKSFHQLSQATSDTSTKMPTQSRQNIIQKSQNSQLTNSVIYNNFNLHSIAKNKLQINKDLDLITQSTMQFSKALQFSTYGFNQKQIPNQINNMVNGLLSKENNFQSYSEQDLESQDEGLTFRSIAAENNINDKIKNPPIQTKFQTIDEKINISKINTLKQQKKGHILIVDDEIFNIVSLKALLMSLKLDYQIHTAEDGESAVDLVKQFYEEQEYFQLIFMDINMPGITGIQTTEQILEFYKDTEYDQNINIIAFTAYSDNQTMQYCIQSGMKCFMNKPSQRTELIELVNQYL